MFALDGAAASAAARAGRAAARPRSAGSRRSGACSWPCRRRPAAGFVVEGESRGYKNRIRFFVALDAAFDVAGRARHRARGGPGPGRRDRHAVVPGPVRRAAPRSRSSTLDVTRTRCPRTGAPRCSTLASACRAATWRARTASLLERERARPIYAVTGATISSRALTDGVRTTVDHFRRRWALLAPHAGRARHERRHRHPASRPPSARRLILNGIFAENPVFRLALSLCPAVAVTTTVLNGLILGIAVLVVQVLSSVDRGAGAPAASTRACASRSTPSSSPCG